MLLYAWFSTWLRCWRWTCTAASCPLNPVGHTGKHLHTPHAHLYGNFCCDGVLPAIDCGCPHGSKGIVKELWWHIGPLHRLTRVGESLHRTAADCTSLSFHCAHAIMVLGSWLCVHVSDTCNDSLPYGDRLPVAWVIPVQAYKHCEQCMGPVMHHMLLGVCTSCEYADQIAFPLDESIARHTTQPRVSLP
jgi:hypothetical protein